MELLSPANACSDDLSSGEFPIHLNHSVILTNQSASIAGWPK